jgi:uncharacterized repeat protein (TIGR03803 family)
MKNLSLYRLAVVATALMAAGLAPRSGASTAGFATLLQFCAQGRPCPDGEAPYAGLLMDQSGNLYGTTQWGGARRRGTVFELALVDGEYTESVLYSFCSRGGKSCTDGQQPLDSLIMGPSGELYGTTFRGGDYGDGTVFQLSPAAASGPWTERVLYSFCAASGCSDGALPEAGLTANPSGELYGTTYGGGTGYDGSGVIFELVPNADKTKWAERVLYNFCSRGGSRCTDGGNPAGGVTTDASGNLYGQTERGGASGSWGTVYELIPNARATKWAERALYRFCSEPADNCQSHVGEPIPSVTLIFDASGDLYGTTYFGGANSQGTVYELTPNAGKTSWAETNLYSFCSQDGCADGAMPWSGVIMDGSGNLYGTTRGGGVDSKGTVFELIPNATAGTWSEQVLHKFCSERRCADGWAPSAGLITDTSGDLYGTTEAGGVTPPRTGAGTVFEVAK